MIHLNNLKISYFYFVFNIGIVVQTIKNRNSETWRWVTSNFYTHYKKHLHLQLKPTSKKRQHQQILGEIDNNTPPPVLNQHFIEETYMVHPAKLKRNTNAIAASNSGLVVENVDQFYDQEYDDGNNSMDEEFLQFDEQIESAENSNP
jgi:hypothetical protein